MLGLLLTTLSSGCFGQTHPDPATVSVRRQVQAAYDASNVGFDAKDIAASVALFAPTWKGEEKGVFMDLAQVKQQTVHMLMFSTKATSTTVIRKIVLRGAKAEVTCEQEATIHMKQPGTGQPHVFTDRQTDVDDWAEVRGKWRLFHTKVITDRQTYDGEPWPTAGASKLPPVED